MAMGIKLVSRMFLCCLRLINSVGAKTFIRMTKGVAAGLDLIWLNEGILIRAITSIVIIDIRATRCFWFWLVGKSIFRFLVFIFSS